MTEKMRSMRFTVRGWVVLFAITILPVVYTVTADAAPVTVVNYFETACQTQTRETFGVPPLTLDQSEGLVRWQRDHLGTPEGKAFNRAMADCKPAPAFDFDGMILVHTEVAR